MYVSAIVLAAGKGLRFSRPNSFTARGGIPISKPLAQINSQPVIIYCLSTLSRHPNIKEIIIVANSRNFKSIVGKIRKYRINKVKDIVLGGPRRQDSVFNGLKAIDKRADLALIHDGVRPFIKNKTISSLIKVAQRYGAAITAVPVKATIKKVTTSPRHHVTKEIVVEKTVDRDSFWEVQTPQVFKKVLILKAYKKFRNTEVTDDASLVERLGAKIRVVMGSYFNIKITTPEDLIIAEAILKAKSVKRKA